MGYNLKTTQCALAELEKGGISNISAIFGTNYRLEAQKVEGDSIVDLKLGSSGTDFNRFKDHRVSLMEPPFSSSTPGTSKRPRTPGGGGNNVISCLVDGCKADLSKCRDYHRRHKVCEMHSKTPRVTIRGLEQRFCQQCSRFHSLEEFDEGKRSCRKRLEGHNRRRRKPQPEPLPVNHSNFLSVTQGSRSIPFSNQQIVAASSVVSATTNWCGAIKTESNSGLYSSSSVSGLYSQAYRGRQFPFLQGSESNSLLTVNNPNSASGNGGSSGSNSNAYNDQKMFCNGLNQVIDSDRALSLLSSTPAETPEMGLGRVIHPSPIHQAQPMISGLHYNSIGQFPGPQLSPGLERHSGGSGLFSNLRTSNHLCQDVFQGGSDASSASGAHQTLSFSWE